MGTFRAKSPEGVLVLASCSFRNFPLAQAPRMGQLASSFACTILIGGLQIAHARRTHSLRSRASTEVAVHSRFAALRWQQRQHSG